MAALPSIIARCTTSTRDVRSSPSTGRKTQRATGHGGGSNVHSIKEGMGGDARSPRVRTVRRDSARHLDEGRFGVDHFDPRPQQRVAALERAQGADDRVRVDPA